MSCSCVFQDDEDQTDNSPNLTGSVYNKMGDEDEVKQLEESKPTVSTLMRLSSLAASSSSFETLKTIIDQYPDEIPIRFSGVVYSVENHPPEVVELFLDKVRVRPYLIGMALAKGRVDSARLLHKRLPGRYRFTELFFAIPADVERFREAVRATEEIFVDDIDVKILLDDPDLPKDQTPSELAVTFGFTYGSDALVDTLVKRGERLKSLSHYTDERIRLLAKRGVEIDRESLETYDVEKLLLCMELGLIDCNLLASIYLTDVPEFCMLFIEQLMKRKGEFSFDREKILSLSPPLKPLREFLLQTILDQGSV